MINGQREYWSPRNATEMAQSLIHEGLHLVNDKFTDVLLGEIISGKTLKGKDADDQGSKIINEAVQKNCK